jgi:hypothetical protein
MVILTEKEYLLLGSLLNKKADEDNRIDLNAYANGLCKGYTEAKKVLFTEEDIMKWYGHVKTHTVKEAFEFIKKQKSNHE